MLVEKMYFQILVKETLHTQTGHMAKGREVE